jgi:mono/diheme cytochrome c family protein
MTLVLAAAPALAQDAEQGKVLYETHCATCHAERLHHRDKSKIKSLADLRDEVSRWAPQTNRRFTLDEREAIVQYLNASHYRREK